MATSKGRKGGPRKAVKNTRILGHVSSNKVKRITAQLLKCKAAKRAPPSSYDGEHYDRLNGKGRCECPKCQYTRLDHHIVHLENRLLRWKYDNRSKRK